ncbi:HNH endonuclease signature motif containing protein, partial [Pengzhenrongella frigida]
ETTWHAATTELTRRRTALQTFGFPLPDHDSEGGNGTDGDAAARDCADGAAGAPGAMCFPPATWEDGTPVPFTVIAVALCDCEITRIVLDAQGTPVNLGRTQRRYTGALRRAVIARDRHCSWPGCALNARWCQIHHLLHWGRDHGETSADNGVLLCDFHHHETHRRDLTITRHPKHTPGYTGDGIALVSYQFRDRNGHPIGREAARHGGHDPGDGGRAGPPPGLAPPPPQGAAPPPTGLPAPPPAPPSTNEASRSGWGSTLQPPDELDLGGLGDDDLVGT